MYKFRYRKDKIKDYYLCTLADIIKCFDNCINFVNDEELPSKCDKCNEIGKINEKIESDKLLLKHLEKEHDIDLDNMHKQIGGNNLITMSEIYSESMQIPDLLFQENNINDIDLNYMHRQTGGNNSNKTLEIYDEQSQIPELLLQENNMNYDRGDNSRYYYHKYLKYKTKYNELKLELNNHENIGDI